MTRPAPPRFTQQPAVRALLAPALATRRAALGWRHRARLRDLDRLRSVLAADAVVRLDAFDGTFAVGTGSDLFERIALDGHYEPELAGVCRAHLDLGRDAIDVGANVGFYTVLMARALPDRRVLAIEPTPAALGRLKSNLERNGVSDRTVIFEGAAAAAAGRLPISVVDGREEYASLGALVHASVIGAANTTLDIAATTLDALVAEHELAPGFIKIDVEGAEMSVLQGAAETLRVHRPVVLAELTAPLLEAQGTSAEAVLGLFREAGYSVSDPLAPGVPPGRRRYGDVLAVPSERRR